ncbi:FtsJ cell division protein [Capsaspora owczarzaki ATCC 30864]|uniref:Putative rRNA methyltransferase n=1 Tax=Capsaspora owczarzaki (strain ATCC 30864) TaxID=595528 RepID=A0A0D2WRW8_CAPO3|nr:FtsJ cell division protein [Capsaspora owczarzaki ATCC 30864]KJE94795.1 FtsJ cell division protein [Capsaspora owczarzaki ATCC 30864]|eukprot:XP_004347060.1 FtsJ cell division protein [Capsaspora owczarzaki ATCC 30864]
MPKKQKVGKTRRDKFYKLAKEAGYRSRAAFKLIQLNRKYNFLGTSRVLLDLCAAPGGWLQVASKHMPVSSVIIGVDRVQIKPIHNVICLTEDITTDKCRAAIRKETKGWKVDCVLHDGAPNVGTSWTQDAYTQAALVLMSLKIACEHLGQGGWYITKVFRSADYNALVWVFQQFFKKVHATKPQASRNESAEIFVVCQGYNKPDKIDPRMFDPKYIFSEVEAPAKPVDLMSDKPAKKAKAVGYPDGDAGFHRQLSAQTFVLCDEPITFLAQAARIVFDDSPGIDPVTKRPLPSIYLTHRETTDEIKACCADIRVLGKSEVKNLLRWRLLMREYSDALEKLSGGKKKAALAAADESPETALKRARSEMEGSDDDDGDDGSENSDDEESEDSSEDSEEDTDDENAMETEVSDLEKAALAERKRLRRKAYKKRIKMRERLNLKMDLPDDVHDIARDDTLFDLNTIHSANALKRVAAADVNSLNTPELLNVASESHDIVVERPKVVTIKDMYDDDFDSAEDDDTDDETGESHYSRAMDRYLDKMYEAYKEKKNSKVARVRKGKRVKKLRDATGAIIDPATAATEEADDSDDPEYAGLDEDERREKQLEKLYKTKIVPDMTSSLLDRDGTGHVEDEGDDSDDSDDMEGSEDEDEDEEDGDDSDASGADDSDDELHAQQRMMAVDDADEPKRKGVFRAPARNENPLLANLEENSLTSSKKAKLWFSDKLFADNGADDDDDDLEIKRLKLMAKRASGKAAAADSDASDEDDDDDDDDDDEEDEEEDDEPKASSSKHAKQGKQAAAAQPQKNQKQQQQQQRNSKNGRPAPINSVSADGFEIVPAENVARHDSDDDDDAPEGETPKERSLRLKKQSLTPEGLALGTLMLSRAKKRDLVDASYHRYAFADKLEMPSWFAEDEVQHIQPTLPITKQMVREYRQRLRDLNATPIKKVAEAKARKRMRLERNVTKAKQKAQAINDAPDLTEAQKARQIAKLMKSSSRQKKVDVKYIVARKDGSSKPRGMKGPYKMVDGRMKKEVRSAKRRDRKARSRR